MVYMNKNPKEWIYILISERRFQCPALDPFKWIETCAETFPDIVKVRHL